MKTKLKYLILVISFISFFGLGFFISTPQFINIKEDITSLFYWLEFLIIFEILIFFNLRTGFLFYFAFGLIVIGAIINTINSISSTEFMFGEILLRVAFVPLVIGTLKNIVEVYREVKTK